MQYNVVEEKDVEIEGREDERDYIPVEHRGELNILPREGAEGGRRAEGA